MAPFLARVRDWADEGERHGIPRCCGLRFGVGAERPKVLGWVAPRLKARVRLLTPRMAFAAWDGQGYVPCEAHLMLYLLTGWRPYIKQDKDFEYLPPIFGG